VTDVPSQPSPTEQTPVALLPELSPSRPRFDWGAFTAHLTTFFSVVIVLGLAIGFLLLRAPVRQKAEAFVAKGPVTIRFEWPELKRPDESAGAGKVATKQVAQTAKQTAGSKPAAGSNVAPAPREKPRTWLAPQFQEELMTMAYKALGSDPDPLSREPLDAIGAAMERSGWFDGRPSVLRGEAQEIVIKGSWRIPAAVVRFAPTQAPGETATETKDYLISWDARPMPVVYPEGKSGLLVIRGVSNGPAKDAGGAIDYRAAWQGEDVEAGIELLRTLMNQPWRSQVAGIDVTDYASSKQLTIETIHKSRLIWGGRASKPLAGECSTQAKLGKINDLVAYTRRIDGEKGEIEIWWPINKTLEIDRTASKPVGTSGEATANAETPQR
jgi:hypothetical protein